MSDPNARRRKPCVSSDASNLENSDGAPLGAPRGGGRIPSAAGAVSGNTTNEAAIKTNALKLGGKEASFRDYLLGIGDPAAKFDSRNVPKISLLRTISRLLPNFMEGILFLI